MRRVPAFPRDDGERERRTAAERRLDRQSAFHCIYDLPADRQTEAVTGDTRIYQTDEGQEYASLVRRCDTDAIVGDSDDPAASASFGSNANFRWLYAPEFHRIIDQALKQTYELHFVAPYNRQPIHLHQRTAGADVQCQILRGLGDGIPQIDTPRRCMTEGRRQILGGGVRKPLRSRIG